MRLENSFVVGASPEDAWALLVDVPGVVPCMPGAELLETVDDRNWKAQMKVKLGPMALVFRADVAMVRRDDDARSITLAMTSREARGRGSAQAEIESRLEGGEGETRVVVVTDLKLSGSVAQFGRGVLHDVSEQILARFGAALEERLRSPDAGDAPAAAQAELSALGLAGSVIKGKLTRTRRDGNANSDA